MWTYGMTGLTLVDAWSPVEDDVVQRGHSLAGGVPEVDLSSDNFFSVR